MRHLISYRAIPVVPLLLIPLSLAGGVYNPVVADSLLFTSSNLPIIVIDTHGQSIPDEPKIPADMGIIDNGPGVRNTLGDPFNGYNGKIGIEVRGSSSQMFPKLQFGVETRDSLGNNLNAALLGMPTENDWVLAAEYNDKSLMRNTLLYGLANQTGRYASRARYCELVLNNDYRGVYILFEKIKRDKKRVNITKMDPADTSGDARTGGYIVKIDKVEGANTEGWYSPYPPYPGAGQRVYYQYDYPKPEDLTDPQRTYITSYISGFEAAMAAPTFADSVNGYPGIVDVASFVDMVALSELSRNVDSYRLSFFMYKDRDSKGGRLVAGPVWDYDLAFGNADYYDASLVQGFELLYMATDPSFMSSDGFQPPFWWKRIFTDPPFQARLKDRWKQLRAGPFATAAMHASIDSMAFLLAEAQDRNFRRWPILGTYVWPNAYIGATYQDEVTYLKQWTDARVAWLDAQWNTESAGDRGNSSGTVRSFRLEQNYPNPFNPNTVVRYQVPVASDVRLAVFDPLGREVSVLVNERQEPGSYEVRFEGSKLASGMYLYRLTVGAFTQTQKMVLIK